MLESIELDRKQFSLHSLCSGGTSAAANAGMPDRHFKHHGRWWRESANDGYVQDKLKERLCLQEFRPMRPTNTRRWSFSPGLNHRECCSKRWSHSCIMGWAVLELPSAKLDHKIFEDGLSAKIESFENFQLYSRSTLVFFPVTACRESSWLCMLALMIPYPSIYRIFSLLSACAYILTGIKHVLKSEVRLTTICA